MTEARRQHPRLVIDRGHGSIRLARHFVAEQCRSAGVEPDVCQTAVLLTSEVVTNALVHARSEARLGLVVGEGSLRVEVGDDSPERPAVSDVEVDAASGRGLWLVDKLAVEWGVSDGETTGKVVWFELSPV